MGDQFGMSRAVNLDVRLVQYITALSWKLESQISIPIGLYSLKRKYPFISLISRIFIGKSLLTPKKNFYNLKLTFESVISIKKNESVY